MLVEVVFYSLELRIAQRLGQIDVTDFCHKVGVQFFNTNFHTAILGQNSWSVITLLLKTMIGLARPQPVGSD